MRPDAPGARLEWLVFSKEARTWVAADLACTPALTVLLQPSSPSSSAAAGEGLGVQLQRAKLGAHPALFCPVLHPKGRASRGVSAARDIQ